VTVLHVVRVFCGPDGRGGNPLGVFVDHGYTDPAVQQAIATELGFSETVFVESIDDGVARIRIYTPAVEMPFAGHPTVGTSWLLASMGRPPATIRVPAGDVATWQSDGLTWVRARGEWAAGAIDPHRFATPAEVDALGPDATPDGTLYAWAWADEEAGIVRSRFFAASFGIPEDEATGLAAVAMGAMLGRPITIRQGVGSELYVRPDRDVGTVAVGGRVEPIEVRDYHR